MTAIAPGDAHALTRALVQVDSRNPTLASGAPGERPCAELLRGVLESWGFDTELHEAAPDARTWWRGSGAGRRPAVNH